MFYLCFIWRPTGTSAVMVLFPWMAVPGAQYVIIFMLREYYAGTGIE